MSEYAGADWVKQSMKIKNMSPLGEAVADLLGDVFKGIYHLNPTSLRKVEWNDSYCIDVVLDRSLSSVDSNELTVLIVLAHDRTIRVEIYGIGPRYMKIMFHQRKREGDFYERCPTIENQIKWIREHYNKG